MLKSFNTQPPEGGWNRTCTNDSMMAFVSTHSRPKAAGSETIGAKSWSWFQHTAARRRLGRVRVMGIVWQRFQHTAARRRLESTKRPSALPFPFQHTAARRRLGMGDFLFSDNIMVSTHSRPKAAGRIKTRLYIPPIGFNTQPPEGGWHTLGYIVKRKVSFNTQPPEGGWSHIISYLLFHFLFQHTAARRRLEADYEATIADVEFQHTAARRRLASRRRCGLSSSSFQHTAARRRLGSLVLHHSLDSVVSTHSRPKAAGALAATA